MGEDRWFMNIMTRQIADLLDLLNEVPGWRDLYK
jgi:hypothetical protein